MKTQNRSLSIRWLYLAVGVVSMVFAGVLYAWSILKAPFATEFGWTPAQLALNFTITMCFFCLGGLAGAFLSRKCGTIASTIIAGVLSAGGFMLTSQLAGDNVVMLYLSYGVLAGGGIGVAYNVVIAAVSAWFPDKKGVCSGCLMMGFGASALVLGNLSSSLMEAPDFGWRATYLLLGGIIGGVLLMTALILRKPGADVVLPQPKKAKEMAQEQNLTTKQMLGRPSFWLAFFYILGLIAVGSSVISFAKDLTISVGAKVELATTLVGVLSIFNGVGRILTGALFDLWGQRKTMIFSNLLTIFAAAAMLVAVLLSSVPLCIVGLCLTGLSYDSCPTTSAAFTSSYFGMKHFSSNMAVMNLNLMLGSMVATLSSSLYTATGDYIVPFAVLLGMSLVSLVLNFNIRRHE